MRGDCWRWTWLVAVAVSTVASGAWAGPRFPELTASAGGTFAILGVPDAGGASVSVSALWPVAPGLTVGVVGHGDDAGTVVDSLRDAAGHGLPGGKVDQLHRAAWGVSWRADLRLPDGLGCRRLAARRWLPFASEPYVSGSWGFYRIADDVRGRKAGDIASAGFSLAAGWRYALGGRVRVGPVIRYHRLFNDRMSRFASVGLECAWR